MRIEGSDKRGTTATLIARGVAVMDVSPADLACEGTWYVQAEPRVVAAAERAAVFSGLAALPRSEMTGAPP